MSTESPLPSDPELSAGPESDTDSDHAVGQASFSEDDGVLYDEEVTAQQGILGFTLRELLIVGVWLVVFVTSFFPVYAYDGAASLWAQGVQWFLAVGLTTAAVFLIVLRRFSPDGIRRVGSLGIDQFASVAFSVSALYWATGNWDLMLVTVSTGEFALTWVTIVQFVAALALVVLTVFAPLIPGLCDDFRGRLVTLAHRNANPVRPVIPRPRPEKPAPQAAPAVDDDLFDEPTADEIAHSGLGERVSSAAHTSGAESGAQPAVADEIGLGTTIGVDDSDYVPAYARTSRGQDIEDDEQDAVTAVVADPIAAPDPADVAESGSADHLAEIFEDLDATAPREIADSAAPREDADATETGAEATAAAPTASSQPFWALAPTERDVFDERGVPLFRIGPTAWALVLEDRGGAYVVRHDDGRIGYLHDVADMTRG